MKTASVSQLLSATVVAMAISVVNASDDAPAPKAGSMPTVLNGSFEQSKDSDTRPDSWFAARPPKSGALCTMARRTDFAKDGSASAYIEISANHSGDRVSYNWVTQLTDLSPGKDYVLEGWIKTENAGSTPVIVVQCWGKKNEWLGFATTEKEFVLTGSNDWKPVKTKFNVPEGTEKVLVRAALSTDKNQGAKAWFDGIAVAESK